MNSSPFALRTFLEATLLFCIFINVNTTYGHKSCMIEDTLALSDLPYGVFGEVISFVLSGEIMDRILNCPGNDIQEEDIKFWLFNRKHPQNPVLLDNNNWELVKLERETKIVIHGWLGNISDCRMMDLKNAYLKVDDYDVIVVQWDKYAFEYYSKSACSIQRIADILANYLCYIADKSKKSLDVIHLIGHSLGGQMGGLVGQKVKKICSQQLGRITGLDPAGPLFGFTSEDHRLDSSDAKFVDVIHTNGMLLGYMANCGTVDYFVNGGIFQKGCTLKNIKSLIDVITLRGPLRDVLCDHFRSVAYMVESVTSERFVGKSCKFSLEPSYSVMGEYASTNSRDKEYCLRTNSKPPFALGEINGT